jgi:phosphatidylglycerophosphatase A
MKVARQFVVALATLGPIGKLPAPGTWGSAAGIAFYAVVFHGYNSAGRWQTFALIALIAAAFATLVCHLAELFLKKKDPGSVILDEFVAMPLVFAGFGYELRTAHHAWAWYLVGFLLFRLFDIATPFGIRELQRVGGGFGIVVDDLLAAAYACGCLHALHWMLGYLR